MKNSAAVLLPLILLLAACSSDEKGGAAGSPQAAVANECPAFEGVYVRKADEENPRTVEIHTKKEDGFFHYSFGADSSFLKADGQELELEAEGKAGKLKVSCDKESVSVNTEDEEGIVTSLNYLALSENQLKITTGGGDVALMEGVYTKE